MATNPLCVSASPIKSPISPFKPRQMSEKQILNTIDDDVNCASLAKKAGYDGVEIMGSEGYLLNQFLSRHVNQREDRWVGRLKTVCVLRSKSSKGYVHKLVRNLLFASVCHCWIWCMTAIPCKK